MQAFLSYRVAEAMTARPIAIDRAASLAEVAGIFEDHDFNSLPVVDSNGRLLGVVSKVDLLKAFVFGLRDAVPAYEASMARPAGEVMRSEPVTVTPIMPLSRVLRMTIHTGLKSFPVVDGDRLVGMIAREDVVRALRCAAADGRQACAQAQAR